VELVDLNFDPAKVATSRQFSRPVARPFPALPPGTDFSALRGKRLLALVDEDNLRMALKAYGVRIAYRVFLRHLKAEAQKVSPWVVCTRFENDDRRDAYLKGCGWNAVAIARETVMTVRGPTRKANADMDLCFVAGYLARGGSFDAVLIGSGDGDLCLSIARGIKRIPARREVFTLSVPRSTSHRILCANEPGLFDGNIIVGRDICK